tara:strand:+ start:4085 stop:4567 length:483 start_codon:yes stop_codon:yes gene_type:complete
MTKIKKLNILDIELAITNSLYKVDKYLVVPNVRTGLGLRHECDLLAVTSSKYATEIEIKTTKADTKKDKEKKHQHKSDKIKYLYFALPWYGEDWIEYVPDRAGIILIKKKRNGHLYGHVHREPTMNKGCRKLTDKEYMKLGHLAAMRIFNLKKKIKKLGK